MILTSWHLPPCVASVPVIIGPICATNRSCVNDDCGIWVTKDTAPSPMIPHSACSGSSQSSCHEDAQAALWRCLFFCPPTPFLVKERGTSSVFLYQVYLDKEKVLSAKMPPMFWKNKRRKHEIANFTSFFFKVGLPWQKPLSPASVHILCMMHKLFRISEGSVKQQNSAEKQKLNISLSIPVVKNQLPVF